MSESDDSLDMQEVKQAVQKAAKAAHTNALAAVPRVEMPDPYVREVAAAFHIGMKKQDVLERVNLMLGLREESSHGDRQMWAIQQSTKWVALEATFTTQDTLQSWCLLRTNGTT